ncbi:MAG: FG-GAP repeat protein, partial [Thermoplasmata archaeon]|nr:FG-GAP repeat protein [Thermoplasmata archaeon]
GQTYLILGKSSGWSMDTDLSSSDASFWGEDADDYSGHSVSGAGDVNGDGFDDILIGAYGDEDGGGLGSGQTYLIFGRSTGWSMDTDLSSADASFWGEDLNDYSGWRVSGTGDVNGDGYCDILIGAYGDDDAGSDAGQTYLILGRVSPWKMDTSLSDADASFWGEDSSDRAGVALSCSGDVNGDGFDDILIGASRDEDGGSNSGQTYLVLGKASGWSMDFSLRDADGSFWGEDASDLSGASVSIGGDVNGDGFDDILIGAGGNDDGGSSAGQTYLIFYETRPPAPHKVTCELSVDGGSLALEWNVSDYWKDLTGFNVYRSTDGEEYSLYAEVNSTTSSFEDTDVILYRYYRYYLTSKSYPELESLRSRAVEVMNDMDSDADNIGDMYDRDILGPLADLQADIDYMNSTLFPVMNEIWNMVDYTNRTLFPTLNDVWNIVSYMNNTSLQNHLLLQQILVGQMSLRNVVDQDHTQIVELLGENNNHLRFMNSSIDYKLDLLLYLVEKSEANITSLNGTVSLKLDEIMALVAENNNDMTYMNSTLDLIASMAYDLIREMEGANNTLHQELSRLAADLSSHDQSLSEFREALEVNITTIISLMNTEWANVTVVDDAVLDRITTNLTSIRNIVGENNNDIAFLNGSITLSLEGIVDDLGTVISDLDGVNNTLRDRLDLIRTDLLSHMSDLQDLSDSIDVDIATLVLMLSTLGQDMEDLDAQLSTDLQALSSLISRMDLNVTTLGLSMAAIGSQIDTTMQEIIGDIADLDVSLGDRIDDIEWNLTADLLSLNLLVESANNSLHMEISSLEADISTMRADVVDGLGDIILHLEGMEGNLTGEIDLLEVLVEEIDTVSIALLSERLDAMAMGLGENDTVLMELITDLGSRLDLLDLTVSERLENISSIMATMEELDVMALEISEIGSDLEALGDLEEALSDVESQQEETSSSVSATKPLLWFLLFLVIIVVGCVIYIAFWKRGNGEVIQEVSVPPSPSKVVLDLDDDDGGPRPPSQVEIEDDAGEDGIRWDD